jgi:hypothetical protein
MYAIPGLRFYQIYQWGKAYGICAPWYLGGAVFNTLEEAEAHVRDNFKGLYAEESGWDTLLPMERFYAKVDLSVLAS